MEATIWTKIEDLAGATNREARTGNQKPVAVTIGRQTLALKASRKMDISHI